MIEKKRMLGILCILVTAGFLFAGLWPFDFSPRNCAYWLPEGKGLYFDGRNRPWKLSLGGIAYTPSPLVSSQAHRAEKGSLTIEIDLQPAKEPTSEIPHILSLFESRKEMLYVGQWKKSLVVRWFSFEHHGGRLLREMEVGDALIAGKARLVTIVSGQEGTTIYLEGELAKHCPGTALLAEGSSIRGQYVALGNSPEFKSPWAGSIQRLALYERSLSEKEVKERMKWSRPGLNASKATSDGLISAFVFEEPPEISVPDLSGNKNNIMVPERVILTNNILLWPDWNVRQRASLTVDMIVNVLGFVPLGFLLSFRLGQTNRSMRRHSYLLAVLMGALISLCIEVTQAYIPTRDSSMVDLICNTTGAALGSGCWGQKQMVKKPETKT